MLEGTMPVVRDKLTRFRISPRNAKRSLKGFAESGLRRQVIGKKDETSIDNDSSETEINWD